MHKVVNLVVGKQINCIGVEGWLFTHTPLTIRWSATASGRVQHSIHISSHSAESQGNQATGTCLPTFSDESSPGLALLAETAAKKLIQQRPNCPSARD